jgi:hypothetical protein
MNRQDQQAVTNHYLEKKKETVALFRKQKTDNIMVKVLICLSIFVILLMSTSLTLISYT